MLSRLRGSLAVAALVAATAIAVALAVFAVRDDSSVGARTITGRFGGDCTPVPGRNAPICFCNGGESVCFHGESFVNGLGSTVRPPVGQRVTIRIRPVRQGSITRPTAVALATG